MRLNILRRLGLSLESLAIATLVSACCFCASAVEEDEHGTLSQHSSLPLNPDFLERYQRNAAEIKQLQDDVKNAQRSEIERFADYRKLKGKYPDHALHLARELVADTSSKIAEFAVSILGSAVVMSDHKMSHSGEKTRLEAYIMQRHEFALKSLRGAQLDSRREIRNRATQTLASLSDEIGLQNIVQGAKAGRYSEIETVNHLGLAKPEISLNLIQPYLQSDSADVQAAAVHFLASSTTYRNIIRDTILLNADAPLLARLAASEHIGSDPNIALLVLNDGKTPPELFQRTMLTYLHSGDKQYSSAELNSLRSVLETYRKDKDNVNFKELETELNKLKQSNSP
ncbi:MAG: hypothetical protein ABL921_13165 [Pirellula sp.]